MFHKYFRLQNRRYSSNQVLMTRNHVQGTWPKSSSLQWMKPNDFPWTPRAGTKKRLLKSTQDQNPDPNPDPDPDPDPDMNPEVPPIRDPEPAQARSIIDERPRVCLRNGWRPGRLKVPNRSAWNCGTGFPLKIPRRVYRVFPSAWTYWNLPLKVFKQCEASIWMVSKATSEVSLSVSSKFDVSYFVFDHCSFIK